MTSGSRTTLAVPSNPADLSPATFDDIRDLVYRHSGIALGDNKQPLVKARIQKRMRTLGVASYEEYVALVRADQRGVELQQLLEAISTNVTSFYREKHHFVFLREVLTQWRNEKISKIRVWSAACSSGEEPYTIAIELSDELSGYRCDLKILATDLAEKVLLKVQAGEYDRATVEPIPAALRQRYFTKISRSGKELYVVNDELRSLLLVRQFNLTHFPYVVTGPIDLVFCRNVMIYFDRPTRTKIINEFSRIVRPGGYLFVGHSESLSGLTSEFQLVKPSIYQRI